MMATQGLHPRLADPKILGPAADRRVRASSIRATLIRNPVMFTVEVVATLTTILFVRDLVAGAARPGLRAPDRPLALVHGAVRQLRRGGGRGPRQGAGGDPAQGQDRDDRQAADRCLGRPSGSTVPAPKLRKGDVVLVEAGDLIPSDGEVIEGVASVNEAAITGESAPGHPRKRRRPLGGDRRHRRCISDWIKVRITAEPGSTFLDRMIALVEGAERQKTPNEIALNILLAGMTIIFIFSVASIPSFAAYAGGTMSVLVLVALFVTLIPTTIGALLSAIGIAGMDRLVRFNVLAMSGRAVEAAGDVDTLLLDKTGTITLGNRQATEFLPVSGVSERELADAAQLASLGDETPGGPLDRRAGQGEVQHPRPGHGAAACALHSVLGATPASAASMSTAPRSARARSIRSSSPARPSSPRRRS